MSVREQIMAITTCACDGSHFKDGFTAALAEAADIAEAREKELLKEIEDLIEDYNLLSKDFAQLSNDKASLIADIRACVKCDGIVVQESGFHNYSGEAYLQADIEAILAKYEAKP